MLCIFATMSVAISSKLSYILLLTTLGSVTATLIFLTVTMQNTIYSLHKNLFAICYKQLHPSDADHYQGEEPMGQQQCPNHYQGTFFKLATSFILFFRVFINNPPVEAVLFNSADHYQLGHSKTIEISRILFHFLNLPQSRTGA